MSPLYLGAICGNMFSTINAYSVVIVSYAAGIDFIQGIYLRIGGLVLSILFTIGYLYGYYRWIQNDERNSITYNSNDEILRKNNVYKNLKQKEEDIPDGENLGDSQQFKKNNDVDEEYNNEVEKNTQNENNEKTEDKNEENKILIKKSDNENKIFEQDVKIEKISKKQWAYMIIFCLGIISIIPGVAIFEWTITQMAAVFFF